MGFTMWFDFWRARNGRGGIRGRLLLLAALGLIGSMLVAAPAAHAQATIDHMTYRTPRWVQVFVNSPAMQRIVQVDVLLPSDTATPHPSLYVYDGNGSDVSEGQSTWTMRTDAVNFFADKPVNVVLAVGGGGTFYTDWERDDPGLGHIRFETFFAQELPPLIDATFHGNGRNAAAGVSMGGMAAMALTFRNPSLYRAVAAYSGCMYTATFGQTVVRAAVAQRGGNADNMWGTELDPQWDAHDPSLHAAGFAGKPVFLSVGSGIPRPDDIGFDPTWSWPGTAAEATTLETGSLTCTKTLDTQLHLQGVPATVTYYPFGTHSWPYWQQPLHDSWPTLAQGLGI
ncbi:alpha/beta hydrolase [Nocardia sp. CA-151230]|uniref:alpha/beta hydrolase n=1 Tax=Nocardia sp. CA-151230 TaxID=3239982 RepID=UPI003D91252C